MSELSKEDQILVILGAIRDELVKLNERSKPKTRRESVLADDLPIIASVWNEWAHPAFPKVVSMETGSTRYKNAVARFTAKSDREYWIRVVQRVNESTFCRGNNDRKWKADIEWLTRPDVHARILEGKYDDKKLAEERDKKRLVFNESKNAWEYAP